VSKQNNLQKEKKIRATKIEFSEKLFGNPVVKTLNLNGIQKLTRYQNLPNIE